MPDVVEETEEELDSWVIIVRLIPAPCLTLQLQIRVGNRGDFPRLRRTSPMENVRSAPSGGRRSNGRG